VLLVLVGTPAGWDAKIANVSSNQDPSCYRNSKK
jgi:hypothetical protein